LIFSVYLKKAHHVPALRQTHCTLHKKRA